MLDFIQAVKNGVLINVRVHPSAKKTGFKGTVRNMLKIDVAEKPEAGKANKELITYLAQLLNIEKNRVSIIRGTNSRNKVIFVSEADIDDIKEKFKQILQKEMAK